tara:strand:+ start:233 stop:439 length:207 start_codon:yes stop_codon:yes gene_type:complete
MASQQSLKFTIKQDGTISEEVIGAKGNECILITERIESKIGDVIAREFSPAFYETEDAVEYVHDSEGC